MKNLCTDFFKGIIVGFISAAVLVGAVCAIVYFHNRDTELLEYVEKQNEIQTLREDYTNRNPYEFLDDTPGARRAADDATAEFERKRNEAVQRLRSRLAD